jgi:8-oxo-dGTP diphosphatase
MRPKFCSQCAAPLQERELEGRARLVCDACAAVAYENPLPVAAAIVLNRRREVLLVKRANEPYRGAWCLPMGFAELGEKIGEAACRELAEETGVAGRVERLVDADSFTSEKYGDLVIVTFEITPTGGELAPGDEVDDARYFPLGQLPPMPFASNARALRLCTAHHLQDWEIQDSFHRLQGADDESLSLLSDELVEVIEQHAEQIARAWAQDVLASPTTMTYRQLEEEHLVARATLAISQFGRWFKGHEALDEVKLFYRTVGQQRRTQGFKPHEMHSSLTLLKKHIWRFAHRQGVWDRPIDVYRALELNRLMAVFFDRAAYYVLREYDRELNAPPPSDAAPADRPTAAPPS